MLMFHVSREVTISQWEPKGLVDRLRLADNPGVIVPCIAPNFKFRTSQGFPVLLGIPPNPEPRAGLAHLDILPEASILT